MFDYIPKDLQGKLPTKDEHLEIEPAFRGAKYQPNCPNNFVPSYVVNPKRVKSFSRQKNIALYSISLFDSIDNLNNMLSNNISLIQHFKYLAIGKTNIQYGYSSKPSHKGHINYYLFDYINNNPYGDFSLREMGDLDE